MNKWLMGLIGLVLMGGNPVLGQSPAGGTSCHDGAACNCGEITCVPQHYIKKIPKTVYSSGSEPLCVPSCWGLFGHHGCDSVHCEHPYTRRYLLKKTYSCEEEAVKCVPSCHSGACGSAAPCCDQSAQHKAR